MVLDANIAPDVAKKCKLKVEPVDSVEYWLKLIDKSDFVVTDSFHGCCFAMILNKPFIVIKNQGRGGTRFDSVLEMFDLKHLMIDSSKLLDNPKKYINKKINYKKVNKKIEELAKDGKQWLIDAIEKPKERKMLDEVEKTIEKVEKRNK